MTFGRQNNLRRRAVRADGRYHRDKRRRRLSGSIYGTPGRRTPVGLLLRIVRLLGDIVRRR